jgi:hypothetical protein
MVSRRLSLKAGSHMSDGVFIFFFFVLLRRRHKLAELQIIYTSAYVSIRQHADVMIFRMHSSSSLSHKLVVNHPVLVYAALSP